MLEVISTNEHLAIINKPSGLAVQNLQPQLEKLFAANIEHMVGSTCWVPTYVHRLDKLTTGCLVIALSRNEARRMSQLFERRDVSKTYLALVKGEVCVDSGTINAPLAVFKDNTRNIRLTCVSSEGKESASTFRVMARSPHTTLLELRPKTGRMHQLRVHCASLGHPIIGDPFYNPDTVPFSGVPMYLHAGFISFPDETGRPIAANASPPDYFMESVLRTFGRDVARKLENTVAANG